MPNSTTIVPTEPTKQRQFSMEGAPNCVDCGPVVNPEPGNYYVSVVNGRKFRLLLGPFTNHATALAHVRTTRDYACRVDPQAHWYAFGTVGLHADDVRPGILNEHLGYDQIVTHH